MLHSGSASGADGSAANLDPMIDVRLLREDPDTVMRSLARRGIDETTVGQILALDQRRREVIAEVEGLRSRQNELSRSIASASNEERPRLIAAATEIKEPLQVAEDELAEISEEFDDVLAAIPNFPDPRAPDGETDEDAVEIRRFGDRPEFDFTPQDHVDLLQAAGALDMSRAAKVSGARFFYLLGEGALLEFALVRYAMEIAERHGHVPVIPPVLVRSEAMYGTGFLPTDEQQIFVTRDDDLYLVGTSEVALAAMRGDEVLDEVPVRYAGFSTCFRREAGSYGRDTRGIFRVHQFDKVELFSFVAPDSSEEEHERILSIEEEIMGGLELHYRIVDIPVGDLGASAARKFDIEAWMPGQKAYREITSCSNTTDYQARRLRVRHRPEKGGSTQLVHTLNGTALAVARTIVALVEQHQHADGSVRVPEALQPYVGREVLFGS
jgi:seryl-tRNA synthetase